MELRQEFKPDKRWIASSRFQLLAALHASAARYVSAVQVAASPRRLFSLAVCRLPAALLDAKMRLILYAKAVRGTFQVSLLWPACQCAVLAAKLVTSFKHVALESMC